MTWSSAYAQKLDGEVKYPYLLICDHDLLV